MQNVLEYGKSNNPLPHDEGADGKKSDMRLILDAHSWQIDVHALL